MIVQCIAMLSYDLNWSVFKTICVGNSIKGAGGVPDLGMVKIEFYNVSNRGEQKFLINPKNN